MRCGAGDGIESAVQVTAATAAHCSVAVRSDHETVVPAGWSQRCLQFANDVEQTAATLSELVCSSKPLLHECVASTAFDAAYERSTLSNETIPFVSARIELHFAATHVGGVLDGSHVPAESHASDGAPISEWPTAHVNETSLPAAVATVPAFVG